MKLRFMTAAFAAALMMVAATAAAQSWQVVDDDSWCKSKPGRTCEVREITLDAWDEIDARTVNGAIRVEGWDRDEVRVRARIIVKGKDRDETLDEVELHAGDGGIYADGPRRKKGFLSMFGGRDWSVSFRIMVPRDSKVDVHTTNGGILVSGVDGGIEFGTTNGGVDVEEAGGDVKGGTTNGGISVSLKAKGWKGERVDLSTTNGGISIGLPGNFSAEVEVRTVNGGIGVELPMEVARKKRNQLSGRMGDGDATLRARTTNGGVSLVRADA